MDTKIGYILNESGVLMEDFDIIDSNSKFSKDDIKIHSPNRVIGYGRLQTGNERNRNGRIYTTEDLAREIAAPRQQELLAAGQLLSRCGHPLSNELIVQQTINPAECCARFHKLWMNGDDVMAYFEGTLNDLGETFDRDLRIGVKPAFSLRALGTVRATPQGARVENLKMITYDYVVYPSHPHAYTQGVLAEAAGTTSVATNMDATKSAMIPFNNATVLNAMNKMNESAAIDYIKDKSFNYHMLKECFDMTKIDTVDIINSHQLALTEAGNQTIVMNIEDYIAKELQNYKG